MNKTQKYLEISKKISAAYRKYIEAKTEEEKGELRKEFLQLTKEMEELEKDENNVPR